MKNTRIIWMGNHQYKSFGSNEIALNIPEIEKYALDDIIRNIQANITSFRSSLIENSKNPYYKRMDKECMEVMKGNLILRTSNINHIEHINLFYRGIKKLPKSIGDFSSLKTLNISNNNLYYLPESIGNLRNLEVISAKDNNLSFITESIENLTKLQVLDFSNNSISYFPRFFYNIKKYLFTLYNFKGNPIRSLSNISFKNLKELAKWINSFIAQNKTWQNFSSFQLTAKAKRLIEDSFIIDETRYLNGLYFNNIQENTEILQELFEYYKKDPISLANQYISSKDLTEEEEKRLIHEADHNIRIILEEHLPDHDKILCEINKRLKILISESMNILL